MNAYAKENAFFTAVAGLVLLAYGWLGGGLQGVHDRGPVYDASFVLFSIILKYGGAVMLAVGAWQYTGQSLSILADAIVSGLCGLTLFFCGITWIVMERSIAYLNNILVPVVSIFLMRNAAASFAAWRRAEKQGVVPRARPATSAAPRAERVEPAAPPAPHPASLASSALPKDGEPPPDEGYLAALAREKQEPPNASYE